MYYLIELHFIRIMSMNVHEFYIRLSMISTGLFNVLKRKVKIVLVNTSQQEQDFNDDLSPQRRFSAVIASTKL